MMLYPGSGQHPERLIDYSGNTNITGFANAVDDAIQVLELIHSTDLIVYSPYFVPYRIVNFFNCFINSY